MGTAAFAYSITPDQLLQLVPQAAPFRFLDDVVLVGSEGAVCRYTFTGSEWFYPGHFPDDPVTPGVLLLETMAQTAVLFGTFLLASENGAMQAAQHRILLTDAQFSCHAVVRPGAVVECVARKVAWRAGRLRVSAELSLVGGAPTAKAEIGAKAVRRA